MKIVMPHFSIEYSDEVEMLRDKAKFEEIGAETDEYEGAEGTTHGLIVFLPPISSDLYEHLVDEIFEELL